MILTLLLAWPALAALAALFMYCCGTVSDGARGDSIDEEALARYRTLRSAPAIGLNGRGFDAAGDILSSG